MKYLSIVVLALGMNLPVIYAQQADRVSLDLPIRNSLKFNRFLIHPALSWVKEQNTFISLYSKQQWIDFENAPQTNLATYSGRFGDNQGIGLAVFQQNYGVFSNFGGLANFAQNIRITQENNLTFGLTVGYFQSGLNTSKVVVNYTDPVLENTSSSAFLVVQPGLNYGGEFLDFGISFPNLLAYNLRISQLVNNNPFQKVSLHAMHTGYVESQGFFGGSRFSALAKTEISKNKTAISGQAMLSMPIGVWTQLGYHSIFGISAGIGINITATIALEYNYERDLGGLTQFGSSHELTLAYKWKTKNYNYWEEEKEGSIIKPKEEPGVFYSNVKRPSAPIIENTRNEAVTIQDKTTTSPKPQPEAVVVERTKPIEKDSISSSIVRSQEEKPKSTEILVEKQLEILNQSKDTIATIVPSTPKELAVNKMVKLLEEEQIKEQELLNRLELKVANKQQNLVDLKLENDLSEKGIYSEPKPFKSVTAENNEVEQLKKELTEITNTQKDKIRELESLFLEAKSQKKQSNPEWAKQLEGIVITLKSKHLETIQTNNRLQSSLEQINEATEIEKKRRIKRANFVDDKERYAQDRATLERIKGTTPLSTIPLKEEELDFGEEQHDVKIIKGVKNTDSGYYLILAVHNQVSKRDDFVTKVVSAGASQVDFFYDSNSSKYFIYTEKFNSLEEAKKALNNKEKTAYNVKMAIVKIEN